MAVNQPMILPAPSTPTNQHLPAVIQNVEIIIKLNSSSTKQLDHTNHKQSKKILII